MLLYAYFAKRGRRKENEFEAEHNASPQDNTPRLVTSEHTDSPSEKSPTSPTDGSQTPGGTLSPSRTGPAPGLTPLDSHAGSSMSTEFHHEHPDVSPASSASIYELIRNRSKDVHGTSILSADHELSSTRTNAKSSPLATKPPVSANPISTASIITPRSRKSQVTCPRPLRSKENAWICSST